MGPHRRRRLGRRQQPLEGLALSNAGRAGLAGFLKTLAAEVAADGVTVNMVLPGRIETDRVSSVDVAAAKRSGSTEQEIRSRAQAVIPAGRYGRPEEFAAAVVFLGASAPPSSPGSSCAVTAAWSVHTESPTLS